MCSTNEGTSRSSLQYIAGLPKKTLEFDPHSLAAFVLWTIDREEGRKKNSAFQARYPLSEEKVPSRKWLNCFELKSRSIKSTECNLFFLAKFDSSRSLLCTLAYLSFIFNKCQKGNELIILPSKQWINAWNKFLSTAIHEVKVYRFLFANIRKRYLRKDISRKFQ